MHQKEDHDKSVLKNYEINKWNTKVKVVKALKKENNILIKLHISIRLLNVLLIKMNFHCFQ